MPPAAKAASAASKFKANFNDLSTSPDTDHPVIEQEILPRSSKKKKNRHAASLPSQNTSPPNRVQSDDIGQEDLPRPDTVPSIPRAFPIVRGRSPPSDDQDEAPTTEKVSDQYTPPNEDDKWLQDAVYQNGPPIAPVQSQSLAGSPPVQPGFSTRAGFAAKSPPLSPPQRHSRPISYGGSIPPTATHPQSPTIPYPQPPSLYGSPPAPHMPQQHFYHARDVDLGFPHVDATQFAEEPTLVKHCRIHTAYTEHQQGVILGFNGRVNILVNNHGIFEELGAIGGLRGSVIDAVLGPSKDPNESSANHPIVTLVIHGPTESKSGAITAQYGHVNGKGQRNTAFQGLEYTTRVESYSLATGRCIALVLQTPSVSVQPSYRGVTPELPKPAGNIKLFATDDLLIIASGTSGEVYVFTLANDYQRHQCLAKLWTTVQPQAQRRDSSHNRASDVDVSPADLNRGPGTTERAIVDVNGRWLAICPASSPSRPSLGVSLGPNILISKNAGLETTTAPARPSLSCDVDSPDADTLLGKVARGVAQELVKGAKWLGDQGYQTWQSYWKKDQSPPGFTAHQPYSPPTYAGQQLQSVFPPTHADTVQVSKEPDFVSIYDLKILWDSVSKQSLENWRPLATFQPPHGCSYLSFAPHGLNLLTSSRKGDVQYVWDLMQIKYCRTFVTLAEEERLRSQPLVRQISRYERLSGSTIIDVVWDGLQGPRFAVLTKNKTIHVFDLPDSAYRWPPPRAPLKTRMAAKSIDTTSNGLQHDVPHTGGFFASALNIANKAQPIVANWRGRAPSMGGGLAGIGSSGIGFASATGARSGKVVAAGLSKSLGAASETVSNIRHAGESRLHLKSNKDLVAGRICWGRSGRNAALFVLDQDLLKVYSVRKSKSQDKKSRESTTVFDMKKAVITKLPQSFDVQYHLLNSNTGDQTHIDEGSTYGLWRKPKTTVTQGLKALPHPLSFAEIETNAPFQPFHTDRRVMLSVYGNSTLNQGLQGRTVSIPSVSGGQSKQVGLGAQWAFGDQIPLVKVNLSPTQVQDDDEDEAANSIIYRETTMASSVADGHEVEQIVSTTRRSKKKKKDATFRPDETMGPDREDFHFEEDCEVLDFATDRV